MQMHQNQVDQSASVHLSIKFILIRKSWPSISPTDRLLENILPTSDKIWGL